MDEWHVLMIGYRQLYRVGAVNKLLDYVGSEGKGFVGNDKENRNTCESFQRVLRCQHVNTYPAFSLRRHRHHRTVQLCWIELKLVNLFSLRP